MSSRAPLSKLVRFRYLGRFACTAGACTDSCCRVGWRVDVDEGHFRRLKRVLDEPEVARSLIRNTGEDRSVERFALLVLDDRGACSELDGAGLCSLQQRFGAELLPNTCASYPRVNATVGERVEQTAFLSCPETARLALFEEDAMDLELVAAPPDLRLDRRVMVPRHPTDPYVSHLDDVRGATQALLSSPRYPVASRLFFIGELARDLSPFFRRGGANHDGGRFADAMHAIADSDRQEALHRRLHASRLGDVLGAKLVLRLIASRLETPCPPVFRRVAEGALRDAAGVEGRPVLVATSTGGGVETLRVTPASLLAAHARRRAAIAAPSQRHLAVRLERCFENYARSYWFREWYVQSPDLVHHALDLDVRVAALRWVLLAHPGVERACAEPDAHTSRRLFDEAAVEVFYSFARAVEHQRALMDEVVATIDEESRASMGVAMGLLRV